MTPQVLFAAALEHHQAGQLAQAEALYRQLLSIEREHADVLHLLGVLYHQMGRSAEGIPLIERAIAREPKQALYHANLGEILRAVGRLTDALRHAQIAETLQPQPTTYLLLGLVLHQLRRDREAVEAHRAALRMNSADALAWDSLGVALQALRDYEQAEACHRKALALAPNNGTAWMNLCAALTYLQRGAEAVAAGERAVQLEPQDVAAWHNLGEALMANEAHERAIVALSRALALNPQFATAHLQLGVALHKVGRFAEALSHLRAIAPAGSDRCAAAGIGGVLQDLGQVDEAIACYRRAIAGVGDGPLLWSMPPKMFAGRVHRGMLLPLAYSAATTPAELLESHQQWASDYAEPLTPSSPPLRRYGAASPARPLRIGYVSTDFREHPVGSVMRAVLPNHDPARVEPFCYAFVQHPDWRTAELQAASANWRSSFAVSDERACELIRGDELDVLIDLGGHTGDNRSAIFACKPAPVQVAWFGYPLTTGMRAMDWRITDAVADPAGVERFYVERLWRMKRFAWCYRLDDDAPAVGPLPARSAGHVTFACLNNRAKVTPQAIELWSHILRRVPSSRLMMQVRGERAEHRYTLELFESHQIDPSRIELITRLPRQGYLQLHNSIDICLDPFPYNGGVTTCDALLMGVPVVSLADQMYFSRQGKAILQCIGLDDLCSADEDEYLDIAVRLASNLDALASLRTSLRQLMQASPIMDAAGFTRELEQAFASMCSPPVAEE